MTPTKTSSTGPTARARVDDTANDRLPVLINDWKPTTPSHEQNAVMASTPYHALVGPASFMRMKRPPFLTRAGRRPRKEGGSNRSGVPWAYG